MMTRNLQTKGRRGWMRTALLGLLAGVPDVAQAQTVEPARCVILGDFGSNSKSEIRVARMVAAWQPDVIVTVGDNAYSDHTDKQNAFEMDVVKHYKSYIKSAKDDPAGENTRFFPTLGNHDYAMKGSSVFPPRVAAYEKAFAVPAGEGGHHYYELALAPKAGGTQVLTGSGGKGVVRFFALDSNPVQGWDGHKVGSKQEKWFRSQVKASQDAGEPWRIALFHHTPYVSGTHHQKETHMRQWKLEASGLTAVVTGHEHVYERVMLGAFPFITNGLGGAEMYKFKEPYVTGSTVRYGLAEPGEANPPAFRHGAIFGEATQDSLVLEFWNASGQRRDRWPDGPNGLKKEPKGVQ